MYIGQEKLECSKNMQQSRHVQFPEEVLLAAPHYTISVQIKSVFDRPLYYRLVLTNPDNYVILANWSGKLQPDQNATADLKLKQYESVSTFNYERNRIYILTRVEGDEEHDVSSIGIVVEQGQIAKLPTDADSFARRHVKIHSDEEHISKDQQTFLYSVMSRLGELQSHWAGNGFMMFKFYHPVELEPYILQHDTHVYSVCYQSTFSGHWHPTNHPDHKHAESVDAPPPELQRKRSYSYLQSTTMEEELLLMPTIALPVEQEVRGFFVHCQSNILVWNTPSKLILYDVIHQLKQKYNHEQEFSVRQLSGFICVVLEREIAYFYKAINKRYAVLFKSVIPNLMTLSIDGTLYLTEKKKLTPHKQSFSFWPFSSFSSTASEISESAKSKSRSGNTVYVYDNFNIRKNNVSPDHKRTFSGPVDALQVRGHILLLYVEPEINLYDTRTKQVLLKLEKDVKCVSILQHHHSVNLMNLVSLNSNGGVSVFNIDCMGGVFGAEIMDILEGGISCYGAGKNGELYLYGDKKLIHYNLRHRKVAKEVKLETGIQKIVRVSLNNDCLMLLKETSHGTYLQTRYAPDVLGYIH